MTERALTNNVQNNRWRPRRQSTMALHLFSRRRLPSRTLRSWFHLSFEHFVTWNPLSIRVQTMENRKSGHFKTALTSAHAQLIQSNFVCTRLIPSYTLFESFVLVTCKTTKLQAKKNTNCSNFCACATNPTKLCVSTSLIRLKIVWKFHLNSLKSNEVTQLYLFSKPSDILDQCSSRYTWVSKTPGQEKYKLL